jgi:hypothetical protein
MFQRNIRVIPEAWGIPSRIFFITSENRSKNRLGKSIKGRESHPTKFTPHPHHFHSSLTFIISLHHFHSPFPPVTFITHFYQSFSTILYDCIHGLQVQHQISLITSVSKRPFLHYFFFQVDLFRNQYQNALLICPHSPRRLGYFFNCFSRPSLHSSSLRSSPRRECRPESSFSARWY